MTPEIQKTIEDLQKRVEELERLNYSVQRRKFIDQDVEIVGNLLVRGQVRADAVYRKSGGSYSELTS